jgi:nucleoside phosphorylase
MAPESRDDFRVAIICALPLEADAVLDLFDQHYDNDGSKYGKQEGDTNTYTTGRFGPHDVVLVHMPGMGVNNASMVASKIRLSFEKINLALVVGICGGTPLNQPIILGDVIISDSIIDFTTGRHYPDGIQARSGHLDTLGRPPPEIRGLLSKFATLSMRQRLADGIQLNLEDLCKKSNRARYPGAGHDRLFAASYRHMHRKETSPHECLCTLSRSNSDPVCSKALEEDCGALRCAIEAPETPSRRDRLAAESPAPLVHIGTVATTTVMKSGEHRDKIASENNIIAFEMEGAGVWEHLPCVVIKGVCDYADSHKNKKWQTYAAATAASAAKAFLQLGITEQQRSTAAEGSSKKRIVFSGDKEDAGIPKRLRQRPLPGLQDSISAVSRPDELSLGSSSVPEQARLDARTTLLHALEYEQLNARHATIKTVHAATCEWLLSQVEYMNWQDKEKLHEHHGFLWIKGKPGAGKSTIMKFAYTNAKKNPGGSIAISYFFNARGEHLEKSTCGMYRSLLFQLFSKIPRLQSVLDTAEATGLRNTLPDTWTTETLQSLFRQAIMKLEDQNLTCFVDALDECENNEDQVREMVGFFETLGECAVQNKIRLLVYFSSRHYPHIAISKSVELILELQSGHSEDITKYLNSRLKVGRSKRVEQIKIDVQEKSQGIFLWVVLVIPLLQKAYDHGQIHALGKCLEDIPKDLNELFRDILGRDAQNLENLGLCLRWILYAERPLSPEELYFAISSASETGPVTAWDSEDSTLEDISRFILSSSKGLAEPTRSKTPTMQFIHESVRGFLLKENGLASLQLDEGTTSAGSIHDLLKEHCQRYFLSVTAVHVSKFSSETTRQFPFLDYSIRYVFEHAELAATHGISQKSFLEHFPLVTWIALHDHIEQYKIRLYGTGTSLLYVLTEMNLLHLFQVEVGQSQSVNARGGRYDYPLIAAVVMG